MAISPEGRLCSSPGGGSSSPGEPRSSPMSTGTRRLTWRSSRWTMQQGSSFATAMFPMAITATRKVAGSSTTSSRCGRTSKGPDGPPCPPGQTGAPEECGDRGTRSEPREWLQPVSEPVGGRCAPPGSGARPASDPVAVGRRFVSSVGPFSLPLEWLPEEGLGILTSIRRWADEEVIPVRRSIDEDWEAHELSHPLLSTLCVDLGLQWAAWPKEYGGGGLNAIMSALCLEEMSRADVGLATAASCSVWAMSPIMPPREYRPLMELFTPKFLSTSVGTWALPPSPTAAADLTSRTWTGRTVAISRRLRRAAETSGW